MPKAKREKQKEFQTLSITPLGVALGLEPLCHCDRELVCADDGQHALQAFSLYVQMCVLLLLLATPQTTLLKQHASLHTDTCVLHMSVTLTCTL